jgi:hypothetical protein
MSKRITGLIAMAVGAILGVGRSAVAPLQGQAPITTEGEAL